MTFTPITLGSGVAGYSYLSRTRDAQQAIFERNPVTARETALASEKLADVQTIDDLVSDRTLLKVALGAFGLDEDIDNKAFLSKILESDLSDRRSLANRLTDKRYLALAQAFNFGGNGNPQLPDARNSNEFAQSLQSVESADDLLNDRTLLRASLEEFGLESNLQNTYFLKEVLNSELSDPDSFANRMNDDRLVDFARAFDFHQREIDRQLSQTGLDSLKEMFDGRLDTIDAPEDVLSDPSLREATLNIFGFDDIYTSDFLEDVLLSDLNDPDSIANSQGDTRFVQLARAFNFVTPSLDSSGLPILDDAGDVVTEAGTLKTFLDTFADQSGPFQSADDLLANRELRQAAFGLLGIPQTTQARSVAERVLTSDLDDASSFANQFGDPRYSALADLITITSAESERVYPDGFVDQVVQNYLDRQFEISVGEVEPDMRVALSLERELAQVVRNSSSDDARWFSIMSSPPLRQAFEGALRLPSSFGSIDIDQQLLVLRDRSESFFGTRDVEDFLDSDRLEELRQSFLLNRSTQSFNAAPNASAASIILSTF